MKPLVGAARRRINELRRLIPEITQRMPTMELHELERHGVVLRTVTESASPKVEYELTPLGQSLSPIMDAMQEWGRERLKREAALEGASSTS